MQTGIDVVENSRFLDSIKRNGGRLRERLFSPEELQGEKTDKQLAAAFSAKESIAKALGTGFDETLSWHDIVISFTGNGIQALLRNRALELAEGRKVFLSSTCDGGKTITIALLSERG